MNATISRLALRGLVGQRRGWALAALPIVLVLLAVAVRMLTGEAISARGVLVEVGLAVVVPLVGTALAQGRHDDVDAIASTLLTWVVLLLGPLTVVLWALATPIAGLLVPTDSTNRAAVVEHYAPLKRALDARAS